MDKPESIRHKKSLLSNNENLEIEEKKSYEILLNNNKPFKLDIYKSENKKNINIYIYEKELLINQYYLKLNREEFYDIHTFFKLYNTIDEIFKSIVYLINNKMISIEQKEESILLILKYKIPENKIITINLNIKKLEINLITNIFIALLNENKMLKEKINEQDIEIKNYKKELNRINNSQESELNIKIRGVENIRNILNNLENNKESKIKIDQEINYNKSNSEENNEMAGRYNNLINTIMQSNNNIINSNFKEDKKENNNNQSIFNNSISNSKYYIKEQEINHSINIKEVKNVVDAQTINEFRIFSGKVFQNVPDEIIKEELEKNDNDFNKTTQSLLIAKITNKK